MPNFSRRAALLAMLCAGLPAANRCPTTLAQRFAAWSASRGFVVTEPLRG